MSGNRQFRPPSECPVCGATVPAKARACPECGADERTGWDDETTRYDGLDLPDETFHADGEGKPSARGRRTVGVFWWVVGAGLLLLVGVLVFTRRF